MKYKNSLVNFNSIVFALKKLGFKNKNMSNSVHFFRKYYKRNITEDQLKDITELNLNDRNFKTLPSGVFDECVNLHTLDLSHNRLTVIQPDTFKECVNLHTLNLYYNNLTAIQPDTFKNNVNLHTLDLSFNNLTAIQPDTFKYNVNLHTLELCSNDLTAIQPDTFKNNVNLDTLSLNTNELTVIQPDTFKNNINLHILVLSYNKLSSLPLEIINLRNLLVFDYYHNPIENIHPVLARFIDDRIRNDFIENNRGIYTDTQSVHSHAIQESVRNSIINILKDAAVPAAKETKEEIIKDDVLTALTKELLIEYCNDTTTHSSLYVTFEDLFIRVWNRIKQHSSATELKQILNQEMKESECKCFTGRLSRLINVLSGGFFDDVNITIQLAEQIGNVILAVKERLEREGSYSLEKHREIAAKELTEREYETEVIKVWLDEI